MSIEQNKAVIKREIDESWNRGDFSAVPEMISPDFAYRNRLKGREGFIRWVSIWRTACPDMHVEIQEMVGEGETVAVRLSWAGTFTGEFEGNRPNGKKIGAREAWFFRFKDGKDLGPLPYGNVDAVLKQMGVDASPPPTQ